MATKTLLRGTKVKATTKAASDKLSLKLLIDRKFYRVLFAEAGKDFVDFLLNLSCLPVGSIVRHLSESNHDMAGCLGNLYESVEKLSDACLQRDSSKDDLLNPKIPSAVTQDPLLLPMGVSLKYFVCGCLRYVTDNPIAANCPRCEHPMSHEVQYVGRSPNSKVATSTSDDGGFVTGAVTYLVMDDLKVMPMSTISSITLLKQFNIKDVGTLEEKVVDLGMEEGLELLRVSLQSKAVLTQVFLGNTRKITTECSSPEWSGDETQVFLGNTRKITTECSSPEWSGDETQVFLGNTRKITTECSFPEWSGDEC